MDHELVDETERERLARDRSAEEDEVLAAGRVQTALDRPFDSTSTASECMIIERYRDSDAAMEHAANLGDMFADVLATFIVRGPGYWGDIPT